MEPEDATVNVAPPFALPSSTSSSSSSPSSSATDFSADPPVVEETASQTRTGLEELRISPKEYATSKIALASFPRSGNSLMRSLIEQVSYFALLLTTIHYRASHGWVDLLIFNTSCLFISLCVWQFTGYYTGSDNRNTTLLSQDLKSMGLKGCLDILHRVLL